MESYQSVTDPESVDKYDSWLDNESAHMALDLYARAWTLTPQGRRGERPVYYIALVPGGNYAAIGLRLVDELDSSTHAHTSFIKLSPKDWAFSTTFLHETGHVILSMLNGGIKIPKKSIASISHATSALTDRGTAFDEGFAIHLETLAAHHATEPFLRERYYHRRFMFGVPYMQGEYHRHAGDLLGFSQTIARYYEVRENNFAFSPAYRGPDYLRVQLEKSRDFASLRDANQLLQSEGFYASFFFGMLVRGRNEPKLEVVRDRQHKLLVVMAELLDSHTLSAEDPFLLLFVESYIRKFPDEAGEVVDVLLDLSHGVFIDRDACTLWREHYLGALRLDMSERNNKELEAARDRWREEVLEDFKVLYRNLGPQIRVEIDKVSVILVAFGESRPLSFDINTAEEGIMRLVPGITGAEVEKWLMNRAEKSFMSVEDFRQRSGLKGRTLDTLSFD